MDDEPDFLEQARLFLEKGDDRLDIETTTSAEEALKMLEEGCYDAVVSDYQMPGMDGLEFLQSLRDQSNDIPFIIFTGKGRKETAIRSLSLGANRYLQKGGNPRTLYQVLADVIVHEVEHKRTEEELRENEERYRNLLNSIPQKIFYKNKDSEYITANPSYARDFDLELEELVGKTDYDLFPEELAEKYRSDDRRVMELEERMEFDEEYTMGDEKRLVHTVKSPVYDAKGNVRGVLGVFWDITKRKEMEERLKEAKDEYEELFTGANEFIVLTDPEGWIKRVNRRATEISGYSEDEMVGVNILKFAYPEDREDFLEAWKSVLKGEMEARTLRVKNKEGNTVWLRAGGRPIVEDGKVVEIQYNGQDITELKEAEEEARRERERFEELFEGANENVVTTDPKGYVHRVNKRVEEETGYSREELEGESVLKLVHPEDHDKAMEFWKRILAGEKPVYEHRVLTKDGETRHVINRGRSIMENGEIVEIQYNVMNITERKEAEEEARREKERFEELFEGANEMIITTDREGYVYRANKAVEEVSGYSEEELKGESILKVAHPDDHDKYIEFWKRVLNGEEPVYQLRSLSKDGKTVHLTAGGRPIIEDGEIIEIQYNAHDITELRKTQEKEEFLHSLLRHDLQNKAQIAQGYHELLKDTSLSEEQKQYLEKAENGVQESVELIDKVRMLRRIREEEVGEVRIDSVIKKVVSENESHASERGIEMEVGCNLEGKVRGGSLLKELFSNLIGNSIQHSGCDMIRVSAQDQDGKFLVSVEDNGKGIPDEDKTKIFERGFKKGSSAGSGLGTFLAKRIAENYGGSIEVKNSELGGAKFDVHLQKA